MIRVEADSLLSHAHFFAHKNVVELISTTRNSVSANSLLFYHIIFITVTILFER